MCVCCFSSLMILHFSGPLGQRLGKNCALLHVYLTQESLNTECLFAHDASQSLYLYFIILSSLQ